MREGKPEEAGRWVDYLCSELGAVRTIFGVWNWHMAAYYLQKAGLEAWPWLLRDSLAPWIGTTAGVKNAPRAHVVVDGRNARLSAAGVPWNFHVTEQGREYHLALGTPEEQRIRWTVWRTRVEEAIRESNAASVRRLLDVHLGEARLLHDVLSDWAWALLTVIARAWGESVLGEVLRVTEEPWVTARYENIRDLNVEDALRLTVEGMRGHLSGRERRGEISVAEESDRFILSFDACGTGGRMRRGDPLVGSGSRLDPPYNFLNIEGAYEWTWNRRGVCAYCAHCAMVNQILPIDKLGRPMRVTLYPENPDQPCRWVIYKDPTACPDDAFTQVGRTRPAPSSASVMRPKGA